MSAYEFQHTCSPPSTLRELQQHHAGHTLLAKCSNKPAASIHTKLYLCSKPPTFLLQPIQHKFDVSCSHP